MIGVLKTAVLTAIVLSAGAGALGVYAQDETLTEGPDIQPLPNWAFPILSNWGVDIVTNPGFDQGPEGTYINADRLRYDPATDIVEANGNVTIVLVREDGSKITLRTPEIIIERPDTGLQQ